jgi:hypothetical protein
MEFLYSVAKAIRDWFFGALFISVIILASWFYAVILGYEVTAERLLLNTAIVILPTVVGRVMLGSDD